MDAATIKFETGKTYYVRSIGDHNCIWRFTVVRRSASSVWVTGCDHNERGAVTRRGLSNYDGCETFSPFGRYSMSPTVSAERVSDGIKDRPQWEMASNPMPAGK